jgi:alkaline phosphatase
VILKLIGLLNLLSINSTRNTHEMPTKMRLTDGTYIQKIRAVLLGDVMTKSLSILIILLLSSCSSLQKTPYAKNHVFYIVDGMGPAHITGARLYKGGSQSKLFLESLPITGLVRTYSTNDFVTDSASSATAYASGVKTFNGAIGVQEVQGQLQNLETIFTTAKEAGKSVGIVTTTRVTHATPAAYFAHQRSRREENAIAAQFLNSPIDLMIGGGRMHFLSKEDGGVREDGRNLLTEAQEKGFTVITSNKELARYRPKQKERLLALIEMDHLPYELDRKDEQLELKELVKIAHAQLSNNPKGYILIVEAARVDHASHMNWAIHAFEDMLAFDRALEVSASLIDKETLLLVTADHETAGLAISGYAPHSVAQGKSLLKNHVRDFSNDKLNHGFISWATGPGFESPLKVDESVEVFRHKATYPARYDSAYHTAVDVPVLAMGPGAEKFSGFQDNHEIVHRVLEILRLRPLRNEP